MKEFVYGTAEQFIALDNELSAGRNYKFANRLLPAGSTPSTACLWFGKVDGVYHLYIDSGISCSLENDRLKGLFEQGELSFASMDEVQGFFHSLQDLYEPVLPGIPEVTPTEARPANDSVIDREKLSVIRTEQEKPKEVWPEDLAGPLKERIYGQDAVIDALADKVVINQMRSEKKLLVMTLLGPTATGKSETAKSLADVMSKAYGRKYGYIEIAGSEFIGEHTVHRFFGAPPGYIGHGHPTLLEPVRKNPYHVIVINEIEKADEKILVGLMEAVDTGLLGMADNSKSINLNRCILLFTSNLPIDMEKYDAATEFERLEMCREAFTKHCGKPEITGKIGNFLAFSPLSEKAMVDVVIKFIREELKSYDLPLAHVDEYLMADLLKYRTQYGARGIRELVNASVGRPLLRARRLGKLKGKRISLKGNIGHIEFEEEMEDAE